MPGFGVNHSDDEMLYMMYYGLLRLEKDADRRRILLQSISRTWEETADEQSIRPERSPRYPLRRHRQRRSWETIHRPVLPICSRRRKASNRALPCTSNLN